MRGWYRCRWVGLTVAMVFVLVLVAGCGGSGAATSSSGGNSAADGGGNSSDGGGSSGGGDSQGGGGSQGGGSQGGGSSSGDELAWVPFGPSDPTVPTPSWPAYRSFANGDCGALQAYLDTSDGASLGDFGKAMVAVCEAAIDGRQDRWEAAAALAAADPSSLANDCLADLVKDLLDRALAWHQSHPGGKPVVRFQRLDGETECGRQANSENSSETTADTETTSSTEPPVSETTTDTQAPDTETTSGTTP